MKKYLAGGRCGGSGNSQEQKDGQGVNQAFQQMLAARDAQMAKLFNQGQTQQTIPFSTGSGLTPFTQTQQAQQTQSKKDDIKLILGRSQIC
jgi:hypothetical protein